jgi:hypothetical protein
MLAHLKKNTHLLQVNSDFFSERTSSIAEREISRRSIYDETPITAQRRVILCYRPMKIAIKWLWKRCCFY